jgi:hypothetical protein
MTKGLAVRPGSQGPQLAVLPGAQGVISIAAGNVARLDATGATVWQVEFPGSKQPEQVMVTPGGKIAVVAENTMLILSPDGAVVESLQVSEPIRQLAWGARDRLAIVGDHAVYVRQASGQPLLTVAEAEVRSAAYTPDGLLVLATPAGLSAYEQGGAKRWQIDRQQAGPVTPDGKGVRPVDSLLISPDGQRILWNDQILDPNGAQVANLVDHAYRQIAVGALVLRMQADKLQAVDWTGKVAWSWDASGPITGLFAGQDERVWVLLQTPDGVQLQALQASSGRPAGRAQPLSAFPTEGVAAGGKVFLRQNGELTVVNQ